MKNYRWFSILILLTVNVFANVTEYQAVAENFLSYQKNTKNIISHTVLEDNGKNIAYVFNLENRGYIVVPIEKKFSPIKAYSFKSDFETLPQKYKEFLLKRLQSTTQAKALNNKVFRSTQNRIPKRWSFLENYQVSNLQGRNFASSYVPNTHLLTSTWNQSPLYNDKFPVVNGSKALTGCVQTAMGQVMRYHKHPANGQGVVTHTWNNEEVKAILYKPYNWDNMPDTLNGSTPEYMKDEIAYLMRDLGIANKAFFQNGETWASYPIQQFMKYFGYSTQIDVLDRDSSNYSQFIDVMKQEIDALRPILLGFPGHLTIADGYREDQTGTYVHVNMGWGGQEDDFYNLDEDVLQFQTEELSMVYNIKPCSQQNNDCHQNLESNDNLNSEQKTISGQIGNQYDSDIFEVYLKGAVTFSRHTGFAINLYDSNKSLLISSFDPISTTLPMGKYHVELSLFNSQGAYYPYNENSNNYSITFTTEELTTSEKEVIGATLEKHPIIDMELEDIVITEEKRILINALDENGDAVHLAAFSNADINTTFEGNVLVLKPNVSSGSSRVIVEAMSKNQVVRKEFTVLINNENIGFGNTFIVSGIFENQEDFNQHEVILSGECTIEGNRGHSSQTFYTAVISEDGTYIVGMNDSSITHTFVSGKYLIGASLKQNPNGFGSYYPYDVNFASYVLSISCPNNSLTIEEIGNLLGIDQSNANNFSDSDGDGRANNVEGSIDTDGDGKANYLDEDSDNDGMSDKKEAQYGFDPLDNSDAGQDSDGDGASNLDEINAGTDPTNQNDYPQQGMSNQEKALFIIIGSRMEQLSNQESSESSNYINVPTILMIEAMKNQEEAK